MSEPNPTNCNNNAITLASSACAPASATPPSPLAALAPSAPVARLRLAHGSGLLVALVGLALLAVLVVVAGPAQGFPENKEPDVVMNTRDKVANNLYVGDLNNDTLPDILSLSVDFTQGNRDIFQIYYQQPDRTFPTIANKTVKLDKNDYYLNGCIAELNGDGRNDIAIRLGGHKKINVYYQNESGKFSKIPSLVLITNETKDMFCYDIDNDNDDDIVYSEAYNISAYLRNESGGVINSSINLLNLTHYVGQFQIADMNKDGLEDFVVSSNNISIFYQRTDLTFLRKADLIFNKNKTTRYIRVGYINNDDLPDVLHHRYVDNNINIFYQSSENTFNNSPNKRISIPDRSLLSIEFGDVNMDGWDDILYTLGTNSEALRVIERLEDGSLPSTSASYRLSNRGGPTPVVADMNGDGRNDIVSHVSLNGNQVYIYYRENITDYPPIPVIDLPRDNGVYQTQQSIHFYAKSTSDNDSSSLDYYWHSDRDGWFGSGDDFYAALSPGQHQVTLWVSDRRNNVSATINITVMPPDRSPEVVISSPDEGADYYDSPALTFDGSGSSDADGDELSFYWVEDLLGPLSTAASFQRELPVGDYNVTLWVDDNNGSNVSKLVSFSVVASPNDPPTPLISAPAEGAQIWAGAEVYLDGLNSSDPDSDALSFYWESNVSGFLLASPQGRVTLPAGSYKLTLWVADAWGHNVSTSVNLTVVTANPPELTLSTPANNAKVQTIVLVKGTVDDSAVALEISVDGGPWQTMLLKPSWQYPWDSRQATNGPHTLQVRATDGDGLTTTKEITVTVDNEKSTADDDEPGGFLPGLSLVVIMAAILVVSLWKRRA